MNKAPFSFAGREALRLPRCMSSHWYDPLRTVESLGKVTPKAINLGGLHAAREVHLAQFFTPDAVARLMWNLAQPALDAFEARGNISLFDNSIGSARLLQFADPAKHEIYGVDVHAESFHRVAETLDAAGFEYTVLDCGMEAARASGMDICFANPPFSLPLKSPLLEPFPCTTFGRFGPNTHALSHEYALDQALNAAAIVVALLPRSFVDRDVVAGRLLGGDRLRAIVDLPANAFAAENAAVSTSIAVFDTGDTPALLQRFKAEERATRGPLSLSIPSRYSSPRLRDERLDDSEPAITRPVTGDRQVRVGHDGRRIILKFGCGATEGRVLNAVYEGHLVQPQGRARHRYAPGIKFSGEGKLDIEVHLMQPDPLASFNGLLDVIRSANGSPCVDPGLLGYLRKRIRRNRIQREPFRHVAYIPDGAVLGGSTQLRGCARKHHPTVIGDFSAPIVRKGEEITFTQDADNHYRYEIAGREFTLSSDEIAMRFEVSDAPDVGWREVQPGKVRLNPEHAKLLRARYFAEGIDKWFGWSADKTDYQVEDLIEMTMNGSSICAWSPGLGKARCALALLLMANVRHGLLVVEAGLIQEMIKELRKVPLPKSVWQIISSPHELKNLRRINIISYERLRGSLPNQSARHTYARAMRRRIGCVVADEGDRVRNRRSLQAKALWQLSAKHRHILTGTPISNYPRDIMPILAWAVGDGTAAQPYGYYRSFMEPRLINSLNFAKRGVDEFRDRFIELVWVTHTFEDDNQSGSKREIPRVRQLAPYRAMIAPHLKRRVEDEPDVTRYVTIPKPTIVDEHIEMDPAHLRFYLTTCDDFAGWYAKQMRTAQDSGRTLNMLTVLLRIMAVRTACNAPHKGVLDFGAHADVTNKQRRAVELVRELNEQRHRTLLFAHNPATLERLADLLAKAGIESVIYHGGKSTTSRARELEDRFYNGNVDVILATYGAMKRGHNIPEADRVILYERLWTASEEEQAIRRVLRPEQMKDVIVFRLHHRAAICEYQAQMCAFKDDAAKATLDYATPKMLDETFVHLDSILADFIEGLAVARGMKPREYWDMLKEAA